MKMANLPETINYLHPQNSAGLQANIQAMANSLARKADNADRKLDKLLAK